MKTTLNLTAILLAACAVGQESAPVRLTVHIDRPTISVSPNLYGIFFEEINHAGDGGVYSELLNNRGFEREKERDGSTLGWESSSGSGTATIDTSTPLNEAKKRSLKIDGKAGFTVANTGFWGIPVKPGVKYKLTIWAKGTTSLKLSLDGANAMSTFLTPDWKQYDATFMGSTEDLKAKLKLSLAGDGTVWIGWASLKPATTWKGHGMRVDLATKISDMKPTFVRFPGGCYVEGYNYESAFDWKKSLGALWDRPGYPARLWGYTSTDGLGLHEYLQWCEDMKAAPLFVVNCGINHSQVAPIDKMGPFVQDALDAIEYANGPVTSKWGALRAKNGHPKSFNLKYVEIGNENGASWSFGGPEAYAPRYKMIFDAIKKVYPEIITIADNPTDHTMEFVDEHYYTAPDWMWENSTRYDKYDRKGPKIYVGEYAVTTGCGRGNLVAALGEAAFMTGMERNSDVVKMASYAPLLENVNQRQWNPNAILFNNNQSYGTPSYHVQALFGQNRPDKVLAQDLVVPPTPWKNRGSVGLSSWKTRVEYKDLELKADGKTLFTSAGVGAEGYKTGRGTWQVADGVIRQNSLDDGTRLWVPNVNLAGANTYTVNVKARKLSGEEGFMIHFLISGEETYYEWNLGGWGNKQSAFQVGHGQTYARVPFKIETDRWYDIRIEGEGNKVRGYVDGKLINEIELKPVSQFTAIAGLDEKTNEVVVKCVNGSENPVTTELNFEGAAIASTGTATVLTSSSLQDENSLEAPLKIAPARSTVTGLGPKTNYTFPARSLTILRVKRK